MKILVFGASGQVGSEISSQLRAVLSSEGKPYSVVLARRSDVDLTDLKALSHFLHQISPDWIVNASAYTEVDKAETEISRAYTINEHAVGVMAQHCDINNSRLIHISTDYVFDGRGELPFCEASKVAPLGVYGASKLAGEEAIRATLKHHLILRTAWVFGVSGGNFVRTMLRLADSRSELSVVGDQFGAPTSAKSIANSIAILISQMHEADNTDQRWGTYHFTGGPFVSWADFANEIFRQADQRSLISSPPVVNSIATEQYPTLATRPLNSRLNCSKIREVFGIEPDNWHKSLGEMLDEIKKDSLT